MLGLLLHLSIVISTRAFVPRLSKMDRLTRQNAKQPSLIVFDLDNTLWTPELFQLRKLQRNDQLPVAGKDVTIFPGAQKIIDRLRSKEGVKLGIASRTNSGAWARDLIDQFGLTDVFEYVEIFPGDKQAHFRNLKEKSEIPFNEMLFFDDNRDGKYGNCVPVSELGVFCCHCPAGLNEEDILDKALSRFEEWDGESMSIMEWDGSVTKQEKQKTFTGRQRGQVKVLFPDKRYGFIRYGDRSTRDLFFHFNELPQQVEAGDELSFIIADDRKTGKKKASEIQLTSAPPENANEVMMRVFSMNQPFAALLANNYKTLETRNGTMFVPYKSGAKFLLHVGKRTYPDGNRHLEIMKSGGLTDEEIQRLKSLPSGFERGMAVAILEIGETYETTLEERSDPKMQQKIGAYGQDSGMRATEIRRIEYLKKPVKISGQGGVFKARVDRDVIPDGWE